MKKKHIYLHVGTTKTGTTSIQGFLIHNRKVFKKYNFTPFTPERTNEPNSPNRLRTIPEFMREAAKINNSHLNEQQQEWLNNLIKSIKHAETDNIILSDELLWNSLGTTVKDAVLANFINSLKEFAKITVLVYLRRQDSFLMSSYQQLLKGGNMQGKTCQQWITMSEKNKHRKTDYRKRLEYFISLCGKNNIIVRPFEKEQFIENSLFADFMYCVGLNMSNEFKIKNERRNPGMSPFMSEIIRNLIFYKYNKEEIVQFIIPKNIKNDKLFNHNRQHKFLSPKERRNLIQCYKEENEWIARKFLGREDGILFREPLPDINESWGKYELNPDEVKDFFNKADFLSEEQRKTMKKQVLEALKNQKWLSLKIDLDIKIKKSLFYSTARTLYKQLMLSFSGGRGVKS